MFLGLGTVMLCAFIYANLTNNPIEPDVLQQIKINNPTDIQLLEKNRMQVLFMQERGWFFLAFSGLTLSIVLWIGLSNRSKKKRTYVGYKYRLSERLTTHVNEKLSFQERLHLKFKVLTSNDLLVAEMLADGLSSKEIAIELNISPASANTARYRLRKRMQLEPDTDLLQFLKQI